LDEERERESYIYMCVCVCVCVCGWVEGYAIIFLSLSPLSSEDLSTGEEKQRGRDPAVRSPSPSSSSSPADRRGGQRTGGGDGRSCPGGDSAGVVVVVGGVVRRLLVLVIDCGGESQWDSVLGRGWSRDFALPEFLETKWRSKGDGWRRRNKKRRGKGGKAYHEDG
jgi:hypothetical protein